MTTVDTDQSTSVGRRPDDILEGGSGGVWHRALLLYELGSELEGTAEEFSYDKTDAAKELVAKAHELQAFLEGLAVDEGSGELTTNRQCRRCSGKGSVGGEYPCIACDGRGFLRPGEED